MLTKIIELMEQTNDPAVFKALRTALNRGVKNLLAQIDLPKSTFPAMLANEIDLGLNTSKVKAVVTYKQRTGLGLMDSKKACEEYFERHNYKFKSYYD